MRTTIDKAGRLVVPKPFRDALGWGHGAEVEIEMREGRLEIAPRPTAVRLEEGRHGVRAVTDREMPTLTAETVRETLARVRR